jgi:hypothetical protein
MNKVLKIMCGDCVLGIPDLEAAVGDYGDRDGAGNA